MKLLQKLTEEQIGPYMEQWKNLSPEIAGFHKQRKKGVLLLMREGVHLYKSLLQHCNDSEEDMKIMPLNSGERLMFIEQHPESFAAYRQLDELFTEMKKIIAGKRVQLKRLNK